MLELPTIRLGLPGAAANKSSSPSPQGCSAAFCLEQAILQIATDAAHDAEANGAGCSLSARPWLLFLILMLISRFLVQRKACKTGVKGVCWPGPTPGRPTLRHPSKLFSWDFCQVGQQLPEASTRLRFKKRAGTGKQMPIYSFALQSGFGIPGERYHPCVALLYHGQRHGQRHGTDGPRMYRAATRCAEVSTTRSWRRPRRRRWPRPSEATRRESRRAQGKNSKRASTMQILEYSTPQEIRKMFVFNPYNPQVKSLDIMHHAGKKLHVDSSIFGGQAREPGHPDGSASPKFLGGGWRYDKDPSVAGQ